MTCIIVKPRRGDDETPPGETSATKKPDLETNEVGAAGDATSCAPNESGNPIPETLVENGDAKTVDTGDTADGDEPPSSSSGGDSTMVTATSQSKAQKRCADDLVADDEQTKRQKTDDTDVELS